MATQHTEDLRVSVVIPCYNSTDTIRECLSALRKQTRPADEIIVVNSSQDDLPEICSREFPEVSVIQREQRAHCGTARNIGARAASCEVVCFIDSDCVAVRSWIQHHMRNHTRPEVYAVAGSIGAPPQETLYETIDRLLECSTSSPKLPARWVNSASGANFSIKAERFHSVGGNAEGLLGCEDFIMCQSLVERYGPIWFEPRAEVGHLSLRDPTMDGLLKHQYRLGQGWVEGRRAAPSLSGAFVLRHRYLTPLLYPARLVMLLGRYARHDMASLRTLLSHAVLSSASYGAWYRGLRDRLHDSGEDAAASSPASASGPSSFQG